MPRPDERAKEFLVKYWDRKFPVNPISIANKTGIDVYKTHDVKYCAAIEVVNSEKCIIINTEYDKTIQRFFIAHMLGRMALGHVELVRYIHTIFEMGDYDFKKAAANRFAANLLMPEQIVFAKANKRGMGVHDLARFFGVDPTTMKIRLQSLGIL